MARKLAILSVIVGVGLLGVLMYAGVIPAIVQGPSPGDLLMALGPASMAVGAIKLKSAQEIAEKWKQRAAAASGDYGKGISAPRKDWATETQAAQGAFEQGIQAAIGRKSFARGVAKAGTAKQQAKALAVGVQRYAPGVTAGAGDFATNVSPYLDTLGRISLPARGAKGDPGNLARVQAVADALHQQKVNQG